MARRVSLVDIRGRRRRMRRMFFWGGIALAAGLLLVGLIWIVFRSKAFMIRNVQITGVTYLAPEDVQAFLQLHATQGGLSRLLGTQNILAWPSQFSGNDLHDLPAATMLRIQKNYFRRTITVAVVERQRVGLWCFMKSDPERCFWFDPGGTLFMPGYAAEGSLIPVLDDYSREPLSAGGMALETRFLPGLLSIFKALQAASLSVKEVRLNDLSLEEIEADTYGGPRLLFSLRFPAAGVPDAINAVEHLVPLANLQYIDFRVQNKVYYK